MEKDSGIKLPLQVPKYCAFPSCPLTQLLLNSAMFVDLAFRNRGLERPFGLLGPLLNITDI